MPNLIHEATEAIDSNSLNIVGDSENYNVAHRICATLCTMKINRIVVPVLNNINFVTN
jgi:hypothetical protein